MAKKESSFDMKTAPWRNLIIDDYTPTNIMYVIGPDWNEFNRCGRGDSPLYSCSPSSGSDLVPLFAKYYKLLGEVEGDTDYI